MPGTVRAADLGALDSPVQAQRKLPHHESWKPRKCCSELHALQALEALRCY